MNDIGGRKFLVVEGFDAIPIDRIKHVDLNPPNGGCHIHTYDDSEKFFFAHHNADAIRKFFQSATSVPCREQFCSNNAFDEGGYCVKHQM